MPHTRIVIYATNFSGKFSMGIYFANRESQPKQINMYIYEYKLTKTRFESSMLALELNFLFSPMKRLIEWIFFDSRLLTSSQFL